VYYNYINQAVFTILLLGFAQNSAAILVS